MMKSSLRAAQQLQHSLFTPCSVTVGYLWSLLLVVLWNMAEYLSDFDDVDDDFEYDGVNELGVNTKT